MKTGINNIIQDMNKNISLSLAVLLLLLTGCGQEPLPQEEMEITIEAVLAENPNTKTIVQDGTTSVLWEPGDEVKVFYKKAGSRFISNNTEPTGQADFTGTLTVTGFFGEGFTVDTPLWAVSPYREDAVSDGESVTTTLISEQTGRAGSFAKNTFITLAKSTNTFMGFYNVCGGVRFSLTHEGIKEIVFQGQNNEDIAGKVKLSFVDGTPAVQEVVEGQKTITLIAPNDGTFETGKWYYIVALPGTLPNGFKMTFNTATQYGTLTSSASRTIKRGIFGSLADADKDVTFKKKEGSNEPNPEDNIQFKDPVAKYACVEKFDTNGDGEVSYAEAANVTSISGLFSNFNAVTSFDELKHFKKISSLGSAFKGLESLNSVTIPEQITELESEAFYSCRSLNSVTFIGTKMRAIGKKAFANCSSLKEIQLPTSIGIIEEEAFLSSALISIEIPFGVNVISPSCFRNCRSLKIVSLPASVNVISEYAFAYTSVEIFDLPASLEEIGRYAFLCCGSLRTINVPSSVTVIGDGVFESCASLESFYLPAQITVIPDMSFCGCHFLNNHISKVIIPETISYLGESSFDSVVNVIIPSSSLVSIGKNAFAEFARIYVQSDMVPIYKGMTNWSEYSDRIYPIDDYKDPDYSIPAPDGTVDMGLSVFWGTCNVGAKSPEQKGGLYAWGETETKICYDFSTYKWGDNSSSKITKYCSSSNTSMWYNYEEGVNEPDNLLLLEPSDDVAHVKLGGKFRMPTYVEWKELCGMCSFKLTSLNGQLGYSVISHVNGEQIFLPYSGRISGTKRELVDERGYYWLPSISDGGAAQYVRLYMGIDIYLNGGGIGRPGGLSIRPVCEK